MCDEMLIPGEWLNPGYHWDVVLAQKPRRLKVYLFDGDYYMVICTRQPYCGKLKLVLMKNLLMNTNTHNPPHDAYTATPISSQALRTTPKQMLNVCYLSNSPAH
jgi:hypothetical protein